ncbi:MAG: RNA polymerase sigma factor [Bacteroidetes bacterium]|nr:MAG: RNA polymerase sigma factor [Bacteroidota bacterium]
MLKVVNGQIEQLGLLFERYHVRLYNFYLRQVCDQDLSRDLTQNTFERVLKYKHTYRADMPFKAWFFQIARNVKADHYKKQKEVKSLDDIPYERNLRLSEEDHSIEKNEQLRLLQEALQRLPEDKREILIMSQLEEMEYAQIAEIYQITENLARVRVHRALKALKEVFYKH